MRPGSTMVLETFSIRYFRSTEPSRVVRIHDEGRRPVGLVQSGRRTPRPSPPGRRPKWTRPKERLAVHAAKDYGRRVEIEPVTVPCQECGFELAGDDDPRLELTCDEPIVYCAEHRE
jgi:hypothetical protein